MALSRPRLALLITVPPTLVVIYYFAFDVTLREVIVELGICVLCILLALQTRAESASKEAKAEDSDNA